MDIETDDSSTDEDRPFIKSKTGEFTYLDADEELLEPFEKLGWFSGRPNYYFAENIFIWVSIKRFRAPRDRPWARQTRNRFWPSDLGAMVEVYLSYTD